MAVSLSVDKGLSKEAKYMSLLPQLEALVDENDPLISNLANVSAALKSAFDWLWVGFYLREGDELLLGPFQGPVACARIAMGKGVCGQTAERKETIIVPDVEAFPGHIACSSLSKSEIVVPLMKDGICKLVLDVDSEHLDSFDETDKDFLEKIVELLGKLV